MVMVCYQILRNDYGQLLNIIKVIMVNNQIKKMIKVNYYILKKIIMVNL